MGLEFLTKFCFVIPVFSGMIRRAETKIEQVLPQRIAQFSFAFLNQTTPMGLEFLTKFSILIPGFPA
jgi:hypothetical protein